MCHNKNNILQSKLGSATYPNIYKINLFFIIHFDENNN